MIDHDVTHGRISPSIEGLSAADFIMDFNVLIIDRDMVVTSYLQKKSKCIEIPPMYSRRHMHTSLNLNLKEDFHLGKIILTIRTAPLTLNLT